MVVIDNTYYSIPRTARKVARKTIFPKLLIVLKFSPMLVQILDLDDRKNLKTN